MRRLWAAINARLWAMAESISWISCGWVIVISKRKKALDYGLA
jgi:hypothetical protein